jgi:hypothetical protein
MTQEQFNLLPMLLTSGQVCRVLGLESHGLRELERAGLLTSFQNKTRREHQSARRKWFKTQVATLAKLKV